MYLALSLCHAGPSDLGCYVSKGEYVQWLMLYELCAYGMEEARPGGGEGGVVHVHVTRCGRGSGRGMAPEAWDLFRLPFFPPPRLVLVPFVCNAGQHGRLGRWGPTSSFSLPRPGTLFHFWRVASMFLACCLPAPHASSLFFFFF